ncbi:hypothetical protein J437_LFUL019256 [Ladona fulva]|uniref:NHR domain-containing protein n=1 Tax=Ladona fulva TaxID=123851 RepID=A0A8K0KQW8_LADFU|nr:hypothetical protein J437_LFUL019256 [Ladona fulva]
MERLILFLLITIFTSHSLNRSEASQANCGIDGTDNDLLSLSITNRRNESGEWVTWFSASKNTSGVTNNLDVVLVRSSSTCRGNNFMGIRGSIKDTSTKDRDIMTKMDKLFFHKKCSNNAVVTNNGRTLLNIVKDADASAITHRPLLDDEVFTVRFDKRENKSHLGLAIGITTHSPDDFDFPNNLYTLKSGTWMFYHANLYHNSAVLVPNILKTPLNDVKIGQTIGVMKSKYGTLHFFIDGVDQGPAASKIPDTVYAVFQVYSDATQGTIIEN